MNSPRIYHYLVITLSLMGFTSVLAGAFGAHALKGTLTEAALGWWQTGTLYMMFHTLSGLCSLLIIKPVKALKHPSFFFIAGNVLFSGSLYALAITNIKTLGIITPVGGTLYLIGWMLLAAFAYRNIAPRP
ncbi:DUF423 domain-containing protein [Marinomonas balearica]|uniref:Uncharacterized membrane protein YgdD (TMEM256/DUF423 family) n=1 Tax=Marinomonas balearica TaxID=491947 RepID=A0A4V3CG12_9GAMM|nr:DUF423 domain-containing protein [Marinomonas balearica]TDO95962.1 uncharacterized membrane protein YgdD (TMEM256/DUF423 family) [Marinomonas balearica]